MIVEEKYGDIKCKFIIHKNREVDKIISVTIFFYLIKMKIHLNIAKDY